ncbi:hypothetical protein [Marinivivus vitaminiproducens]|uniref:hypothetical protein n=1 Tax=Marinivivus vitaminiproducens TaxID=3035935 RepID=UPI00279B0ACC|nr:hypothetical protein P4R82_08000 [Geminicoccaceae bacterium SCSIO 64248]
MSTVSPERTFCFSVTAHSDPATLSRVLEVFALHGFVPSRCHAQRTQERGDRLAVDLQQDGIDQRQADKLAARLRAIVLVETVLLSEKAFALAS